MLPGTAATGTLLPVAMETKLPLPLELPDCEPDFEGGQEEGKEEEEDVGGQE